MFKNLSFQKEKANSIFYVVMRKLEAIVRTQAN